jgi:hypothetical protein
VLDGGQSIAVNLASGQGVREVIDTASAGYARYLADPGIHQFWWQRYTYVWMVGGAFADSISDHYGDVTF